MDRAAKLLVVCGTVMIYCDSGSYFGNFWFLVPDLATVPAPVPVPDPDLQYLAHFFNKKKFGQNILPFQC
jgi:hypothetical protein